MTTPPAATRKRTRDDSDEGAAEASAAKHAAAAAASPAAAAAPAAPAAAAAADAPLTAAAAVSSAASDASDAASDSDSDESDASEYVVVRLPASLVNTMREKGEDSVTIESLDSAHPFFDVACPLPHSALARAHKATLQRFVGTYEYSVGTQILWRIHEAPVASPSPSPSAPPAATASPVAADTPAPPSNLFLREGPDGAATAPTPAPSTAAAAAVTSSSAPSGPHIELMGKTWKRLVFARQL